MHPTFVLQDCKLIAFVKGHKAESLHLFSVPTYTGWQGAGASPSLHWVRGRLDTGQTPSESVYHISGHLFGKP